LRWSVISQLAVRMVSVASGIVLLRLLQPDEYGVYAFALAVVNILIAFNDLGQVLTIARWPGDVAHAARTSTTLALGTSGLCFVACVAAAPLLAEVTDHPEATGVLRLLACMLLVDAVTTVPRALLFRAFKHSRTAIGDLVGTVVNVGLSLSLAAAGTGTWAPAVGTIGAAVVTGVLVLAMAPSIPLPGWDPVVARKLLGFGFPLALATLVELTLLNVDYLIVARELGATALGLYAVAFNVSSWPSTLLTQAIRRVSVAGFAQIGPDPAQLAHSFVRSFGLLVTLLLPVCAALAVLSEPLLRVLYGDRIAPAAWALTWLVTLGGTRVAVGLVFDLLLSQGRSHTTFRLQLVWLVAVVPALALGAHVGGITAVALAHMAVAVLIALPLHLWAARDLGVEPARLAESLIRPVLGVIGSVAVGLVAAATIATPVVALLLGGAVMVAVYFAGALTPAEARKLAKLSR
jgi:PST family polysaccharide transporter